MGVDGLTVIGTSGDVWCTLGDWRNIGVVLGGGVARGVTTLGGGGTGAGGDATGGGTTL